MEVEDPRCHSSWASGTAVRSLWDVLVPGKSVEVPYAGPPAPLGCGCSRDVDVLCHKLDR